MKRWILLAMLALFLGGCARYYRVQDTNSGRLYYTRKVKEKDGSVRFEDAVSERSVTLSSAEVQRVDKDTFKRAVGDHD